MKIIQTVMLTIIAAVSLIAVDIMHRDKYGTYLFKWKSRV